MAPPVGLGDYPLRSSWLASGVRGSRNYLLRKSTRTDPVVSTIFAGYFFESAAGSYTLTATTQTYSAAGVNSILKASRKLVSTQQTYSASPVSGLLTLNRRITSTQQTYTVAGIDSILTRTTSRLYDLYATTTYDGSFAYTYDVGPPYGYLLTATAATYSVTPVNAALKWGGRIVATQQTYSATPVAATLRATRKLVGTQQTYAVSTVNAALKASRKLIATQQTYSASPKTANLLFVRRLAVSVSPYTITPFTADLILTTGGRRVFIIT